MSPKRINGYVVDTGNAENISSPRDTSVLPWKWTPETPKIALSPLTPDHARDNAAVNNVSGTPMRTPDNDRLRRGRPRAEAISSLIKTGEKADATHKCNICNRIFPREKSLQAHLRTHTGNYVYQTLCYVFRYLPGVFMIHCLVFICGRLVASAVAGR